MIDSSAGAMEGVGSDSRPCPFATVYVVCGSAAIALRHSGLSAVRHFAPSMPCAVWDLASCQAFAPFGTWRSSELGAVRDFALFGTSRSLERCAVSNVGRWNFAPFGTWRRLSSNPKTDPNEPIRLFRLYAEHHRRDWPRAGLDLHRDARRVARI